MAALALVSIAAACSKPAPAPKADAWHDPSPHTLRMIAVAPNVSLEVLDWGGSGPPIVMLAGLGDPAHTFDEFGPLLTDSFRVVGITRRGFGASSQPPANDIPTLVADIRAVLDTLKIARANFIGHSIAGDELYALATTMPERCERIVYLDAAYDRSHMMDLFRTVRFPDPPPMTAAESASPAGVQAYIARTQGMKLPEAEVRANIVTDSSGRYLRDVMPDSTALHLAEHLAKPDYQRVRCPSLAIYNIHDSVTQMFPSYASMDSMSRRLADSAFHAFARFSANSRAQFRSESPQSAVLELHGANHYVFINDRQEVLRAVRAFLSSPPAAKRS